jgi:hypothetical protein
MATHEDQPDPLYVVQDGERIIVALDMPGVHGAVEESANGAVELARLVPYPVSQDGSQLRDSTISDQPPGLRSTKAWYGVGVVAGMATGVVATESISLGLGLPLTLAAVVALLLGYRRRKGFLTETWRHRHRVLDHADDIHAFTTARRATERVIDAWPRIGTMVGVADPGPVLARSLWTLSEVLANRSALRDQRDELEQIRADVPPDTEVWHEVDDRVAQLDTALSALDTEVDVQLAAFTDLSERCQRYVREERAIGRARDAVLRADQALGDARAPVDRAREPGHELADRTAAVLDAYQELTRHTPSS